MTQQKDDFNFYIEELINEYHILTIFREISESVSLCIKKFNEKRHLNIIKTVLNIDLILEQIIIDKIRKINLDIKIISEESGDFIIGSNPKYILFLDPLDGTDNLLLNIPIYSLSIAISTINNFTLLISYVKNLVIDEEFFGIRNIGAYFNNKKIENNQQNIFTNLTSKLVLSIHNDNKKLFFNSECKIRALGCVSIELCYVSIGRIDCFVDLRKNIRFTDIAAGILILQETKCTISDINGNFISYNKTKYNNHGIIIASSKKKYLTIFNYL